MKKIICITLIATMIMSLFAFSASAQEVPAEKNDTDPYYEYHLKISSDLDSMRETRNEQIAVHQKQIEEFRNYSMELYNEFLESLSMESQSTYNDIVDSISVLEGKIKNIQDEYFNDVYAYLQENGMEIVDNSNESTVSEDIHLSATDAGKMQTTSSVSYNSTTGEFYYFVEYDYYGQNWISTYVGLNDMWGDYDLVSMQHKENTDWYWNNIIVTANLAYGFYGNSLVGKADKYQILDTGFFNTSSVSNREDFWNGCIFNIKDDEVSGPQSFSSNIRYVTVEGWLKPTGSAKTTLVKSEYEHNYKEWIWNGVTVGATDLDDPSFSLEVSYTKSSGSWRRSAGSRNCTLP